MKKILIASLSLLLCAAMLAGCQPTPAAPAVVQKNDGKLEEMIYRSPAPAHRYETPAHWKETCQREKITILFDTDISLPDTDRYPVVKVEPAVLTQQRVDELVNYFTAGKKLYKYPAVKTKAEYAAQIVEAKRGQEVDGQYVVTEESERWVKELEKRMLEAPETHEREYAGTALGYERDFESGKERTEYGKNFLHVAAETGATEDPTIYCCNYVENRGKSTYFGYFQPNEDGTRETFYIQYIKDDPHGIHDDSRNKKYEDIFAGIPESVKDDYLAQAIGVMKDLQVKDMQLVSTDKIALQGVADGKPLKGGYVFSFTRACGGIAVYIPEGGGRSAGEEPPAYTIPFDPEEAIIVVSEKGVESFLWRGQAKVMETLSENVELLPFEKIQEKVKNQIYYKESFNLPYVAGIALDVTCAELRMGYIPVKDHPGQAMMAPIWVFQAKETRTLQADPLDPENGVRTMPGNRIDFMFNAIDGGVIEIDMGPDE